MAKKALDELLNTMDNVHLEEVEVITNPLRALKDGVKFIPTLKYHEERLSGILLTKSKLADFLQRIQQP